MDDCIILTRKRVGDDVPLTERFSVTLDALLSDQHANPAESTFVLSATLHDESFITEYCVADRPLSLTFQYARAINDAVAFDDQAMRYALSVHFVERHGTTWLIDLCLRYEEKARSEALTLSDHVLRSERKVTSGEKEVERDIFILGVYHDDTETVIDETLPRILAQFERDLSAELFNRGLQTQNRAHPPLVFWEGGKETSSKQAIASGLLNASRYELTLETHMANATHFLFTAYVLLLIDTPNRGDRRQKLIADFLAQHGMDGEDRDKAIEEFGEDGLALGFIANQVIPEFLRAFTMMGEADTRVALLSLLKNEALVEEMVARTVRLYLEVLLSEDGRGQLSQRQDNFRAAHEHQGRSAEERERKWYYSRYFTHSFPMEYGETSIRENRRQLIDYVFDVMHWIVLEARHPGKDHATSYQSIYPARIEPKQMKRAFEQAERAGNARRWVLDERHFADLNNAVLDNYGDLSYSIFLNLERMIRKSSDIEGLSDTVSFLRTLVSFLNVVTVMQKTDATRAILVVGDWHSEYYKELFEQFVAGARVTHYGALSGTLTGDSPTQQGLWRGRLAEIDVPELGDLSNNDNSPSYQRDALQQDLQAYLAMEAVSQWMGPPASDVRMPRLQMYLLMELSEQYNARSLANSAENARYEIFVSRFLSLYYMVIMTGPLYFGGQEWLPDTPPKKRRQTEQEYVEALTALYSALPRILIDMVINSRQLAGTYDTMKRRSPGYIFGGAGSYSIPDLSKPVYPLHATIREGGDRKAGMKQLAVRRNCFQQTMKSALQCRHCGTTSERLKLERSPLALLFCSVECQRAYPRQ